MSDYAFVHVSIRVRGTNGAIYYGRASWDNGTCIWLHKAK